MADEQAKRDSNRVTTLLGVEDNAGAALRRLLVDPTTGRLKVTAILTTGVGDVVGPASATDNAIVRFDTTTGKLIQNSVVTIADTTGNMAGVGTLNTLTLPASDFVGLTDTQTLTNKTLTAPVINSPTGISTTDITEGTNLYYTEARVSANTDVTANTAKVTESTTVTSPLVLTGLDVSIPVATTLADGYLSSADWTTFNGKIANLSEDTTPQLGGDLDAQANHIGFTQQTITYNVTTTTVDWGAGNKATVTLTGDVGTMAFTNPPKPSNLVLKIVQDATGSRVVTAWDVDILWVGGTAPTLTTTASGIDIISFYWDGTNYFGVGSLAFA